VNPRESHRFGVVTLWATRAEEHYQVAQALHNTCPAYTGAVAFHAHQAIEKLLVAFLIQDEEVVPPSRTLKQLLCLASHIDSNLADALADAASLDEHFENYQFPATTHHVTASGAEEAVECARRSREAICPLLRCNILTQSPLDLAQELVYEAWDDQDPGDQRRKCREALRISPDCADAHVLLAALAESNEEAMEAYRRGVEAGQHAIGREGFHANKGMFWALTETRPYMRARCGLARCLWLAGEYAASVEHCADMLRLNPNDNQGMRFLLAGCLLHLNRDDELAQLFGECDWDDSAPWAYWRALWAFRKRGDTPEPRELLSTAMTKNRHIPSLIAGEVECPPLEQEYTTPGGEDEAIEYAANWATVWRNTPGAVQWLRGHAARL